MNRRFSVALATAATVVLAGVAPVHAQISDVPTLDDGTVISDGDGLEATNEEVDEVLDQQDADTPPAQEPPKMPEQTGQPSGDDATAEGGSSGSSESEDSTGFPNSSQDPEKTSSENLSSTLLGWNELSPEAEEAFEWINLIIGILTALTQAALIVAPILNAIG